jgi:flagellar biosynthesis protein FliR
MTLGLPLSTTVAFLLVLARVAGVIAFLPVPGFRAVPQPVRAAIAMAITFALFPVWPRVGNELPSFGQLIVWAFAEIGFGLAAGLAVAFLSDGFTIAAQVRLWICHHGRSCQPGRFRNPASDAVDNDGTAVLHHWNPS